MLTGGGARAAYQVGVLKAIAELLPNRPNPFRVIVGTSAGAVAAAVIAGRARRWHKAIAQIERVWAGFHVEQVFEVGGWKMLSAGLRWLGSLVTAGWLVPPPKSLFDNRPLRELLARSVSWHGLKRGVQRGDLDALALCATSYSSALSVAFFSSHPGRQDWTRRGHVGRHADLHLNHLMASLAVPFLFAPEPIGTEFHGDGAMRQLAPLSTQLPSAGTMARSIPIAAPPMSSSQAPDGTPATSPAGKAATSQAGKATNGQAGKAKNGQAGKAKNIVWHHTPP